MNSQKRMKSQPEFFQIKYYSPMKIYNMFQIMASFDPSNNQ